MSNIRKSFSFRDGIQVDTDDLVVRGNLVGIGTTVPTERLDVRGTAKVVGLTTSSDLFVSGVGTINTQLKVGSSIVMTSGVVTATSFYGNGGTLSNLPTSQWVDVDVGLGFTSIYAAGYVGIATLDPRNVLQIGANPYSGRPGVGISSSGNIKASGIVSATSLYGYGIGVTGINADNLTVGTLDNARLPSSISVAGIITAFTAVGVGTTNVQSMLTVRGDAYITGVVTATAFVGNVSGIASFASFLSGSPNITVGVVTATSLNSAFGTVGVATITTRLNVGSGGTAFAAVDTGRIGIGTSNPNAEISVLKTGASLIPTIELRNPSGESRVSIGNSTASGSLVGIIRYGNSTGALEILNNATGGINQFIHAGVAGVNTQPFRWFYGQNNNVLAELTYQSRLSIGKTDPQYTLDVNGTGNFSSNVTITGNISATGSLTYGSGTSQVTLGAGGNPAVIQNANITASSGITTISELHVTGANKIGLNTTSPLSGFDARSSSGYFNSLGINTSSISGQLHVNGTSLLTGRVAIGTTGFSALTVPGGAQAITDGLQVHNEMYIVNSDLIFIGQPNANVHGLIGMGTGSPFGALDLRYANLNATTRATVFFPQLLNDEKEALVYNVSLGSGGMIFNRNSRVPEYYDTRFGWQPCGIIGYDNVIIGQYRDNACDADKTAGSPGSYVISGAPGIGATNNVLIGSRVGSGLTVGSKNNTFLGDRSGFDIRGNNNLCLGFKAGRAEGQGVSAPIVSHNVIIGVGSGYVVSEGNRTLLGAAGIATTPNNGYFSPPIAGDRVLAIGINTGNTNEYWIVGNSSMNVGIGSTNPSSKLSVVGNSSVVGNYSVTGNSLVTGIATVGIGTTSSPPSNSQMSFELLTDTTLRIKVRGSDGILRSTTLTLS